MRIPASDVSAEAAGRCARNTHLPVTPHPCRAPLYRADRVCLICNSQLEAKLNSRIRPVYESVSSISFKEDLRSCPHRSALLRCVPRSSMVLCILSAHCELNLELEQLSSRFFEAQAVVSAVASWYEVWKEAGF